MSLPAYSAGLFYDPESDTSVNGHICLWSLEGAYDTWASDARTASDVRPELAQASSARSHSISVRIRNL